MYKSFPKRLEEQVARLSAYMNLPEPASGDLFFRLVRMPAKGRETVVDINSCDLGIGFVLPGFLNP